MLPLAGSPGDQGNSASPEMSPSSLPVASSHPFGSASATTRPGAQGAAGGSGPALRTRRFLVMRANGLCSLMGHRDHGSGSVDQIPTLKSAPVVPGLSAPGVSRSGWANSMGPRPSRPGGARRKEAHCPPRNTFWGPAEKAPVLNFRRKSPALAPHRERFVVPPSPGLQSAASSRNICRGKIHPGGQILLALSPENSLKRY